MDIKFAADSIDKLDERLQEPNINNQNLKKNQF